MGEPGDPGALSNSWFWVSAWAVTWFHREMHTSFPCHRPLCSTSAPENPRWTDWTESPLICLPKGVGRGRRPYDILQGVCPKCARWMHRIFHPDLHSSTYECFFQAHHWALSRISASISRCTVLRLVLLVLNSGNETSWGKMTSKCSTAFSPDLIFISFEWFCA